MKKYLVGLIFLVSSIALGMEYPKIKTEIKSVTLKDFTVINNKNCFSVIKLTIYDKESADLTVDDRNGFASLALAVRLIESGYADKDRLAKLVDRILLRLQGEVPDLNKPFIHHLRATWLNDFSALKSFVFANRKSFSFVTQRVTAQNKPDWKNLLIEGLGLIARKKKYNNPPAITVALKAPENRDEEVPPNILSKIVTIQKSVTMASDPLAKIAKLHARRYFVYNENEEENSDEFQLVCYALKSIEAVWRPFSILNQEHRSFWGLLQKVLLPATIADNLRSKFDVINLFENERSSENMKAAWQKPAPSAPLYFAYMFTWGGGGGMTGFSDYRYWIIEVKPISSLHDVEFMAEVTIKAQSGSKPDRHFFEVLCPNLEIPMEEIMSIL